MHSPAVRPTRAMRSCWSGMGATAERAARSASAWLIRGAIIVLVAAYVGTSASPTHVACATKSSALSPTTTCRAQSHRGYAHASYRQAHQFRHVGHHRHGGPGHGYAPRKTVPLGRIGPIRLRCAWSGFLRRSASRMRTTRQTLNRRGSTASPSSRWCGPWLSPPTAFSFSTRIPEKLNLLTVPFFGLDI